MSNTVDLRNKLINDFGSFESTINGSKGTPLQALRKEAIHEFGELGFPDSKLEDWKFTSVKVITDLKLSPSLPKNTLSEKDIEGFLIPNLDVHLIVYVNGYYSKELSTFSNSKDGLYCGSFNDIPNDQQGQLENHFTNFTDHKSDSFTALNTAFINEGAYIFVSEQMTIDDPVHVMHIFDANERDSLVQPRTLLIADKGSKVKLIESYHTIGDNRGFNNCVTEIIAKENCEIDHFKLQLNVKDAYQVNTTHIEQGLGSQYSSKCISWGNSFIRNNLKAVHKDERCQTNLGGLYHSSEIQHIDNHTFVDHATPNCQSNEYYKGILGGRSKGVFNGKILVRKEAPHTNAFQSNKNILISKEAKINTKPQLEIFNDDVKCSHGATCGQLNEEEIFYLSSRGIGPEKAKGLLLSAFFNDIIATIPLEPLSDHLSLELEKILNS